MRSWKATKKRKKKRCLHAFYPRRGHQDKQSERHEREGKNRAAWRCRYWISRKKGKLFGRIEEKGGGEPFVPASFSDATTIKGGEGRTNRPLGKGEEKKRRGRVVVYFDCRCRRGKKRKSDT